MGQNYNEYLRQKNRRKKTRFNAFAALTMICLVAVIVLLNASCSSSDKNSPPEVSAESGAVSTQDLETSETATSGQELSGSVPESSAAESGEVSGESSDVSGENSEVSDEASDKPMEKPVYSNDHEYTENYSRFSSATHAELDACLTTAYVALYDMTADEIIYSKDLNKKIYPASTTKLLTAITASSIIKDPKTVITVGNEIEMCNWESSKAYIEEGMKLTFEMLMDALLLPSGNDAAYTMAVNAAKIYKNDQSLTNEEAVEIFMGLVNDCAKQIGASHTHYVTPDGWHDDDHYTSAYDLAVIGDYAKTVPIVRNSCAKPYVEWELLSGGFISWTNSNKLILENSGFYSKYNDGLKTGFTDEAGTSVVASATMEGHTFIAVAMNGYTLYTKYQDCNTLFRKAFELYDLEFTSESDDMEYAY